MFCRNCGANNSSDAKFCVKCGELLNNSSTEQENNAIADNANFNRDQDYREKVHDSIIRKAIKRSARFSKKGSLCGVMTILVLLPLILVGAFTGGIFSLVNGAANFDDVALVVIANALILVLLFLLYSLVSMILSFGLIKSSLDISRGQDASFTKVLAAPFKNFNNCLKMLGLLIIFNIIYSVLLVIPIVGVIVALGLMIFFLPVLVIYMYIVADDNYQDKNFSNMVGRAMELAKGHRVEFYGLVISFIGWFLLSLLTLGLLMIWIVPYILVALANWYRYLVNEAEFNDGEKGLSNGAIVGLGIVGYLVMVILVIAAIVMAIMIYQEADDNSRGSYSTDYLDETPSFDDTKPNTSKGNIQDMKGLNIFIPNGYHYSPIEGYDTAYVNSGATIVIGGLVEDIGEDLLFDTFIDGYRTMMMEEYTCDSSRNETIDNNAWTIFNCYDSDVILFHYMTSRNGEVYAVIVTASGYEADSGQQIANKIEANLGFSY